MPTIEWTENPLRTKIHLTDPEKEMLSIKVKVDLLSEMITATAYNLRNGNIGFAMQQLCCDEDQKQVYAYLYDKYNPKSKDAYEITLDQETKEMAEVFVNAMLDEHSGDCTCQPYSCMKCNAEELVGTNTIKGLSNHQALKVYTAFGASRESDYKDTRTLDEAIKYLENYKPEAKLDGWEVHVDKWKNDAKAALKWLKEYRSSRYMRFSLEGWWHQNKGDL